MAKRKLKDLRHDNTSPVLDFNVVGIDVGRNGGITVFNVQNGKVLAANIVDMPEAKSTKYIDSEALALWICDNTFLNYNHPTYIFFEEAHAMPKQGVVSMFSFGRCFGNIEGMVNTLKMVAAGNNTELYGYIISPKAWQKGVIENHTWLGNYGMTKARNVEEAIKLYPQLKDKFYGPKGGLKDGRVDSLLIAEFGRRVLTKEIPDFFLISGRLTARKKLLPKTKRNIKEREVVEKFYRISEEAWKFLKHKRYRPRKSVQNHIKRMKKLERIGKKLDSLREEYKPLDKYLRRKGL